MKNILFIHSSSELYGSDRSLLNTIKNLKKEKYNIYVLLPTEGPLYDELLKLGYVHVMIDELAVLRRKNLTIQGIGKYFIDLIKSIFKICQLIKKYNIDIVDTNTSVVFSGAISAKIMHKISIWHIREIISSSFENFIFSLMLYMFSNKIIANSNATKKNLKSFAQSKVEVVHNAIEVLPTISRNYQKDNVIYVGMAGRINRWKGQKLFVDCAKLVVQNNPNVKFLIAGDVFKGEEFLKEELISYIYENNLENNVQLIGELKDMKEFYRNIDIFILPSIKPEPFGLVVLEAMSQGLPVIATNHGGPTEIISDGVSGYLVNYKDAREMAQKIEYLIDDYTVRETIGENAKEVVLKDFSLATMVSKLESIYNNY